MRPEDQDNFESDPDRGRSRSLRGVVFSGVAWSALSSGIAKTTSLLVQFALARLLAPSDFGIAAIAIGLANLVILANPFAFTDLLVQRGDRFPSLRRRVGRSASAIGVACFVAVLAAGLIGSHRTPPVEAVQAVERGETVQDVDVDGNFASTLRDGRYKIESRPSDASQWNPVRFEAQGDESLAILRSRLEAGSSTAGTSYRAIDSRGGMVLDRLAVPYESIPLVAVMLILGIRPLSQGFQVVPAAWLRQSFRFRTISLVRATGNILGGIVAVTVALLTANPVALVIAPSTGEAVVAVAYLWSTRGRMPRADPEPDRRLFGDFGKLAVGQWIHNCGYFVPFTILGWFLVQSDVGQFYFAHNISLQVSMIFSGMLAAPLLPVFARVAQESGRFDLAVLRAQRTLFGLALPICVGIGLVLPWLIPLVFSAKWTPAVDLAIVLFIAQAVGLLIAIVNTAMKARAAFNVWIGWHILLTVGLLGAALVGGLTENMQITAWLTLGWYVILVPIGLTLSLHERRVRLVMRAIVVPAIAILPMAALHLPRFLGHEGIVVDVAMLIGGMAMLPVYALLIRILYREQFDDLVAPLARIAARVRIRRS